MVDSGAQADCPQRTGPHFHFFSGKGGVGKTTLAAATAVHLAASGQRTLITSTDPAHSLADVFDQPIGNEGALIGPNLFALEVDSSARWNEALTPDSDSEKPRRQGRVQKALGEAMRMLGDAPGVDEFMSLELLIETMNSDQFDQVVFDTAPTGHTLRLLLLPRMLDGWVGRLLSIKGTFSRFGRALRKLMPGERRPDEPDISQQLATAQEQAGLARDMIMDPERTSFALVTIPEAMSVLETQRTVEHLSSHDIPVDRVFVNQVQPRSDDCRHCRLRYEIHQRELKSMPNLLGPLPLVVVESKSRVIRGPAELAILGEELWAGK